MQGFNVQQMLKQAQQMQKKMEKTQEELKTLEIQAESGGGVITITGNGKHEIKSIKIKPEALNPEDPSSVDPDTIEMLEDLLTSAFQDLNKKTSKLIEDKMGAIAGGSGINLPPGLF